MEIRSWLLLVGCAILLLAPLILSEMPFLYVEHPSKKYWNPLGWTFIILISTLGLACAIYGAYYQEKTL